MPYGTMGHTGLWAWEFGECMAGLWSWDVDRRNDLWNTAPPAPILQRRELLRLITVPPVYVNQVEF